MNGGEAMRLFAALGIAAVGLTLVIFAGQFLRSHDLATGPLPAIEKTTLQNAPALSVIDQFTNGRTVQRIHYDRQIIGPFLIRLGG